jgi:hypothetical protein
MGRADTCCHLYSYRRRLPPGDRRGHVINATTTWSTCTSADVSDLIAELESFKVAAGWQLPAAWERES